ncbi:MAG: spore coat U domain-containing protein [Rhodospirillales bacterium]
MLNYSVKSRRVATGRSRARAVACLLLVTLAPAVARGAGRAACSLTATPLVFGNYVPFSNAPVDFTATLSLVCTASGTTEVALSGTIGLLAGGRPGGRSMAGGQHHMRYQLYLDAAHTMLWGDGTGSGGTQPISGAAGPSAPFRRTLTVYGRVLARQAALGAGAYVDRVTVLLNY